MTKNVVLFILAAFFIAIIFAVREMKDAYKVLPIKIDTQLDVPQFAEWRAYEPQTKRFKVLLPDPPQYAKESVAIPKTDKFRRYEMYISEKLNGTIFLISLITYPEDLKLGDKDDLLLEIIDEMVASKRDNRLQKKENSTFHSYPAIDYRIANAEFNVAGKVVLVDKTVYLLNYISKKEDFSEADYEHFINSFEFVKDVKPETK